MSDDPTTLTLIRDQIALVNDNLSRRLTDQDRQLREIRQDVAQLRGARERAQGAMAAWKWLPPVVTALVGGGVGSLVIVLVGGAHP